MFLSNLRKQKCLAATVLTCLAITVACYLYLLYDRCCGRDLGILHFAMVGAESHWLPPAEPEPTDACYNDNLLVRLLTGRAIDSGRSRRRPLYVTLGTTDSEGLSRGCLDALTSFPVEQASGGNESSVNNNDDPACFRASLNPAELSLAYAQLGQLLGNFTARRLEIFISDGSLIGSVRHFGVVPWDDDLDFVIRREQKGPVRRLLEQLSMGQRSPFQFHDTEASNQHWKFGIMCSETAVGMPKSCKLELDFFFGYQVGRWFVRPEWPRVFPLGDIYPLAERPFGPGLLIPAPSRPMHFLQRQYRSDVRRLCHYQPHSDASNCQRPERTCLALSQLGRYPFVSLARVQAPKGWGGGNVTAELLLWQRRLLAVFLPASTVSI